MSGDIWGTRDVPRGHKRAWGSCGEEMCLEGLGVAGDPEGSQGMWGEVSGCPGMPRMVPGGPGALASPPLLLPQRCLRRILQGLQHYRDLLGSEIFKDNRLPQLVATLDRLLGVVQVSDAALPLPCARDSGTPGPCAR